MSQLSTPAPIRTGFVTPNVWGTLMRDLQIEDGLPSWAVRDGWVRSTREVAWGRIRDIRAGVITVVGWKRGEDGRARSEHFTLWPSDWPVWTSHDPDEELPQFGGPMVSTRFDRDFEP